MIKVHHLNESRSQRILWLLEELGAEYEIQHWTRDAETRFAPAGLKAIHPLGKSPVIEDGDLVIAESAAIVDYLAQLYGQGALIPKTDHPDHWAHQQWLHFAEGSAILPFLLGLYVGKLGEAGAPLGPRINSEINNVLDYLEAALEGRDFIMGDDLSAADFMLIFIAEIAQSSGRLKERPNLSGYVARIQKRPAYIRALKAGGPYSFAATPSN